MVEERTRDRVWKFALAGAIRNGRAVKPKQIAEIAGASERTVRETLNVIANAGWLRRDELDDGTVRFLAPDEIDYDNQLE